MFIFLFFGLYFVVNALFFNDATMHRIYEDQGDFNIIYQIPQIIYSMLITNVINIIATYLSLTEKINIQLKREKNNLKGKIEKYLKCIKIKLILFFCLTFLLLLLFWYYISCFCAVYRNTQIHLIKDTFICYGFSLFYPILLCLIPGIFRIYSLRAPKQNRKCIYKFSKFIQFF